MEFDLAVGLRRQKWEFPEPLTDKAIQDRLTALTESYEWLKKEGWAAQNRLFLSESLYKAIQTALRQEIDYCKFYLEFQAKLKESNFDKWVFVSKEKVAKEYTHQETHDQWIKSNGRVKAIVEIDKSGHMTKISVRFKNDSDSLKFIDNYYGQPKIRPSHVRAPKSIAQKIEAYKQIADEFLQKHLFPQYNAEKKQFDRLEKLLCVR